MLLLSTRSAWSAQVSNDDIKAKPSKVPTLIAEQESLENSVSVKATDHLVDHLDSTDVLLILPHKEPLLMSNRRTHPLLCSAEV